MACMFPYVSCLYFTVVTAAQGKRKAPSEERASFQSLESYVLAAKSPSGPVFSSTASIASYTSRAPCGARRSEVR